MIQLEPNERPLMIIRRHWFALFRHVIILLAFLLAPAFFFGATGFYGGLPEWIRPLINFILSLYILSLIIYAFVIWSDYYLDVWIITDRRLIDIEQHRLFNRTISELPMSKIQNVTIEIPGFIATVLKFGNLRVETASQSTFVIRDAPNMYEAKNLILKHAHTANAYTTSTNKSWPDTAAGLK